MVSNGRVQREEEGFRLKRRSQRLDLQCRDGIIENKTSSAGPCLSRGYYLPIVLTCPSITSWAASSSSTTTSLNPMWRSLPAHFLITFRFNPVIPSGISCLNRVPSQHDLHRLSITRSWLNIRPYAIPAHRGESNTSHIYPPLSDAQRQTIYALSTPPGKAGVAVVRVSGPDALQVWRRMVQTQKRSQDVSPEAWKMERCRIAHPENGEMLDDGLAVYFRGKCCSSRGWG